MQRASAPIKMSLPFANSAGAGYRRQVPNPSQIPVVPGAASFTDGFPPITFTPIDAGGVPPFGQDMNGVLFQMTSWDRWHQAGGPVRYDNVFQASIGGYPQEARVGSNATPYLIWQSTIDNNTTNPDSAATRVGWQTPVFPTPLGTLAGLTIIGSSATGENGAGIAFDGGGATAPRKWIRVLNGEMQWANHAYNAVVMALTDGGNLSVIGSISGGSISGSSAAISGAITGGSITITGAVSGATGTFSGAVSVGGALTANSATIANALSTKTLSVTNSATIGTTLSVGTDLTVAGDASVTDTFTAGSVSAASATISGAVTANSITTKTLVATNTTPGVWGVNANQIYGNYLQAGNDFIFNSANSGEWHAYVNGGHHVIRHRGATGGDWQEWWDTNTGDWHWQVSGADLLRLSSPGNLTIRGETILGTIGGGGTDSVIRFRAANGTQIGYISRGPDANSSITINADNTANVGLAVAKGGTTTAYGGWLRATKGILIPGADGNVCPIKADFQVLATTGPAVGNQIGVVGSTLMTAPNWWIQITYAHLNASSVADSYTDLVFAYAFPNYCSGSTIQYIGNLPPDSTDHPALACENIGSSNYSVRAWVGRTIANYPYMGVIIISIGY